MVPTRPFSSLRYSWIRFQLGVPEDTIASGLRGFPANRIWAHHASLAGAKSALGHRSASRDNMAPRPSVFICTFGSRVRLVPGQRFPQPGSGYRLEPSLGPPSRETPRVTPTPARIIPIAPTTWLGRGRKYSVG
jgi:hypothetical protein